jgi:hypothetical protein
MIRIFTTLSIVALLLMATALLLGLFVGDLHDGTPSADTLRWAFVHRMMGTGAALVVVLVNCIGVTYFIGSGRWCKEVSETYQLDPKFVRQSNWLKRKSFSWAFSSMAVVVCVGALGAAADPATLRQGTEHWVTPHLIGAFLGLLYIAFAFFVQAGRIAEHSAVIDAIMAEVRRIRQEHGLEV